MAKSSGGAGRARKQSFKEFYAANRKVDEPDHSFLRGRANVSGRAMRAQDARYKAEVAAKYAEREALRKQYDSLIAKGGVQQPSRFDNLIAKARGHSDNAATQAARRLLTKNGIKW